MRVRVCLDIFSVFSEFADRVFNFCFRVDVCLSWAGGCVKVCHEYRHLGAMLVDTSYTVCKRTR